MEQPNLFDPPFETTRPGSPIFCHEEFLEKLAASRSQPVGKRASLLIRNLAVNSRRQHFKATHGVNQGWRRSRLGGTGGSHFYAWWAPKSAAPFRGQPQFAQAPEDAIFLRDIRHHDDHSPASPHAFESHYLPVSVPEMRSDEFGPEPFTPQQARFAGGRQFVRILKGHPGSGKTTALLHAADACGARHVLYLTYSRDLAALARDYFDKFCSKHRRFEVMTFDAFIRRLAGATGSPAASLAEMRTRFRGDVLRFARALGPWTDHVPALFDELHAHLVGSALPVAAGRFRACRTPRTPDDDYKARRQRFLGQAASLAALDVASRLERDGSALAPTYFPELDLAWTAAAGLTGPNAARAAAQFGDVECVCVDECQDLTALEAFATVELAAVLSRAGRGKTPVFYAGDEAQTVRPTDFEWGWMNDLLHSRLATPAEYKLSSNLRSPRSIAELVNNCWDLYANIEKRDRPSGTGYAEIDDDATDQVLYCAAAYGDEVTRCLEVLAAREGLAIVSLDDSLTDKLPPALRHSVLTAREVKGLDFHTVCLVNAGQQVEKILRADRENKYTAADIENLKRRLAIDELRVGISRPSERLIWLDVGPTAEAVRETTNFLSHYGTKAVAPTVPAALLAALEEEQLDLVERIQRCQSDARQFLNVRPELAWSRAQQAVALLGDPMNTSVVLDRDLRGAAHDTLSEICFCLGFRGVQLAPELGRPDLFAVSAAAAQRPGINTVIHQIGEVVRASDRQLRLRPLGLLAQNLPQHSAQLPAWLLTEIASKTPAWVEQLESAISFGDNAVTLAGILPPFYAALGLADSAARSEKLLDQCVRHLIKNKRRQEALGVLRKLEKRNPDLEAECLQETGDYAAAAEMYRSMGKLKEALACYRAAPDFDAAAALIREIPGHPAGESYEWLIQLKALLDKRPANFNKMMTAPEKKVLENLLEQGLGVQRKPRAAAKKTAVKKAAPKKAAPKKTAPKKTAKYVPPMRDRNPYF